MVIDFASWFPQAARRQQGHSKEAAEEKKESQKEEKKEEKKEK